ncbi:MAG: hypothetical protein ACHQAX_04740 [Gammaproteobacteria bacterium]
MKLFKCLSIATVLVTFGLSAAYAGCSVPRDQKSTDLGNCYENLEKNYFGYRGSAKNAPNLNGMQKTAIANCKSACTTAANIAYDNCYTTSQHYTDCDNCATQINQSACQTK